MRLALAQILFVIPARGRILKRNQQLRMVDVSDSAAAQVQALVVNDVSDSEFNFSVHFGLVLGLNCLSYSFFATRCARLQAFGSGSACSASFGDGRLPAGIHRDSQFGATLVAKPEILGRTPLAPRKRGETRQIQQEQFSAAKVLK
jgi:hypothetical protein